MSETPFHVVRVRTPDGDKEYVTLLSPSVAFSKGLGAEAIIGQLLRPREASQPIVPEVFARNPAFFELMHAVIARESPKLPNCRAEAKSTGEGYLYVIDQRTPTPQGAVPPDDVIGAFEVKGGEIVAGSYRSNAKHKILSARGFFQLDAPLLACLIEELETRNRDA